jgi:hypothetical protein
MKKIVGTNAALRLSLDGQPYRQIARLINPSDIFSGYVRHHSKASIKVLK